MRVVELVIDEETNKDGIFAISLVEEPAIELDFVALSKETGLEVKLEVTDKDKRIVSGPILVPNMPILRKDKEGEPYYILFGPETVRKASEMFFKKSQHTNATVEHELRVEGLYLFESWIKEDNTHDKSIALGFEAPLGAWCGSMKIENDEVWNDFIKTGKLKGFSIEGLFEDKMNIDERAAKLSHQEPDFYTILEEFVDLITSK